MKQYNIINRSVHYRMDVLPSSSQHAHSWYKRSHRLSILQGSEIDSDHREFGQHKNIYTMRSKKTNRIWTNTCIDIRTPPPLQWDSKVHKVTVCCFFFFLWNQADLNLAVILQDKEIETSSWTITFFLYLFFSSFYAFLALSSF